MNVIINGIAYNNKEVLKKSYYIFREQPKNHYRRHGLNTTYTVDYSRKRGFLLSSYVSRKINN